jgi:predicted enzyme related to lactoylglutathione lyase
LSIDGQWRAGMRAVFRPELEQRWVPVVRVNSVEQTVGLAGNLGGRVVLQTSAGEDEEATALLADPQGALFIVQEWSDAGIQEVAQ